MGNIDHLASAWYTTCQKTNDPEPIMTTATMNSAHATTRTGATWLARVLAALDRACASSADGARGF